MLVACPHCGRHVLATDEACPHCSTSRSGTVRHTAAALALGLTVACSGGNPKETGDTGTTTDSYSTVSTHRGFWPTRGEGVR